MTFLRPLALALFFEHLLQEFESQREFRERFIPSGLANTILLDVYERRTSGNGDCVISAAEGDIDTSSDGFPDNSRLYIPATKYIRVSVTRQINDGLLAPRFAPSQRAWIFTGALVP